MPNTKIKVIVAMSGGVDSSVAAALLKRAGFCVEGVFMKTWKEPKSNYEESEKRAFLVATKLKIPFHVFDLRREFKKHVINYFLAEYESGRTPNPCIICNKEIKLGLLLKNALSLKADFIATGHYVKKIENKKTKNFKLLRGKNKNKDQSYFLYKLSQEQLKSILFPLGNYTKPGVRKLAKKFMLPSAEAPESQEICFIEKNVNDFLSRYIKSKPGKILNKNGELMGKHRGLQFYTIGQRKGIPIFEGPWYVLEKDMERNFLIVTKNEKEIEKKELIAKDINWISGKEPAFPLKIKAKIRSRAPLILAKVSKTENNNLKVIFDRPQKAITPGQSVVFYRGDELLGGGIIDKVVKKI